MVKDAKGAQAEKALRIEVKERPNRWFEEARIGSLMHGTETKDPTPIHRGRLTDGDKVATATAVVLLASCDLESG